MKTNKPHSAGLEWLREIRADTQRDIGATPQQRAAYYQRREKSLTARIYHPAHTFAPDDEATCVLREEPPSRPPARKAEGN